MMKKNYLSLLILLSFGLFFNACNSDSDVDTKALEVDLVIDEKINYLGGEFFLRITTTGSWKIEQPASDNWYSFSSIAGQGSQTVVLKVTENDDGQRTGKFDVSVGTEKKTIEFTQNEFDEEELYYPVKEAHRIEMPRLSKDFIDDKAAYVVHYAMDNVGEPTLNYSFEYNYASHHTRWVAFTFYDKTAESNTKRSDAWAADPSLLRYTDNFDDYRGSGYDRGHLVASADRLYSIPANEQTFYFSNMSPQINSFNGGIWADLEDKVRSWGRLSAIRDTLYVAKGGTIDDENVMGTIGNNKIAIPKYYFMAVLAKKGSTYKSIAFMLEHKSYSRPYNVQNYAMSVEELEEKTGIDFFHNLPDEIERVVEKEKNLLDWPGL